ncbi:MAG: YIP1 family protein [Chthoniobacterales bacterium]|nr:YIP1 family protein [Chthoniobacterales bacterium]
MKIHLNRAGQTLGQFTPHEVRSGYREGRFTGTDLAWHDGMPSWRPLAEVIDEIAPDEDGAPPVVTTAAESGPAWEQRAELGFFPALGETIRGVLLEPGKTFVSMRRSGGLGAPLFFYVLLGTLGGLAGVVYQEVFKSFESGGGAEQQALSGMPGSAVVMGATIMLLPIILVIGAFVGSGIMHLALMIVGGATRPFEATFRVLCYANGAAAVLQLLPGCGALIAAVWTIVVEIIGLAEVHNIGKGRAALAVFLPLIVCCGFLLALGVLAVYLIGDAAGGMSAILEKLRQQ